MLIAYSHTITIATTVTQEQFGELQNEDLLVRKVRNSFSEEGTLELRSESRLPLFRTIGFGAGLFVGVGCPVHVGCRATSLLLPSGCQ